MRQQTMSEERVRRTSGDAKAKILRAAARVFNRQGTAATIEAIADEAGYSNSALYKHFKGRDAIFDELWRTLFDELVGIFENDPPIELPFEATVKWFYYQIVDVAFADWDFFVAAIANRPSYAEMMRFADSEIVANAQRIEQIMVGLMQRGIDEGAIRSDLDPVFCHRMLDGLLKGMAESTVFAELKPTRESFDLVFEFFLQGAAPRN